MRNFEVKRKIMTNQRFLTFSLVACMAVVLAGCSKQEGCTYASACNFDAEAVVDLRTLFSHAAEAMLHAWCTLPRGIDLRASDTQVMVEPRGSWSASCSGRTAADWSNASRRRSSRARSSLVRGESASAPRT